MNHREAYSYLLIASFFVPDILSDCESTKKKPDFTWLTLIVGKALECEKLYVNVIANILVYMLQDRRTSHLTGAH